MANVFDITAYILERHGETSAVKLQKLVYYAQAWSLVWDERPLFDERIEAWTNGPVVPELYRWHAGKFSVTREQLNALGASEKLSASQRETLDDVLDFYGSKNSQWLSDLTHIETPWRKARGGLSEDARGSHEITLEFMAEYYSSLEPGQRA
jgi:uncharacterized phage-associated protein